MHGWENPILRKEGIKELKRFIDLPSFLKSKKLLKIFYEYYSEGREHEVQKMMDLHDPSESLENPVDTIGKRRKALDIRLKDYYKTKEGRKAKYQIYFATNKLLGIREIEGQKEKKITAPPTHQEKAKASLPSQKFDLPYIKEILLDFFKIYPDVWKAFPCSGAMQWVMKVRIIQWAINVTRLRHRCELGQHAFVRMFKQDDIINRVKNNSYPKISALLALILSSVIVVSLFWNYISQIEIVPTSLFAVILQAILIDLLKGKVMNILMPGAIISFIFILVSSFVLQLIYKLFGGKSSFHETFNLNLYFFSAWIAFVVKGALLSITPMSLTTKNMLGCLFLVILIYALLSYVATLNKLMGVSNKKGAPAFLLFVVIYFLFLKPLF